MISGKWGCVSVGNFEGMWDKDDWLNVITSLLLSSQHKAAHPKSKDGYKRSLLGVINVLLWVADGPWIW